MFRQILVPVDRSDRNAPAMRAVESLAQEGDGGVTLVHVIETIADVPFDDMRDFYEDLEAGSREMLTELVQHLGAAGVESDSVILYGNRVREVLRLAEERGADLIVLDSHIVDLDHPAETLATISYQIAVLSTCSVLLVK